MTVAASGCSAVGSALGSGPRGRGFKSRHSDQKSYDFCLFSAKIVTFLLYFSVEFFRFPPDHGLYHSRFSPAGPPLSLLNGAVWAKRRRFGAHHFRGCPRKNVSSISETHTRRGLPGGCFSCARPRRGHLCLHFQDHGHQLFLALRQGVGVDVAGVLLPVGPLGGIPALP